jgi:RNA polymerase sigma-70 factor, ECF subfamily
MEGVEHVFERMVQDHQDRLYALGYALTGNRHDAEEVAQDTLLRAYRALVRYPPERVRELKQRAWLHRIAVNVARNRHRRSGPRMVELNGSEQDAAPGPETRALQRLELDGVAAALACLPERYREAVVLRCVQDLSYAEAAEVLGQPVGTVKSNVHRGLRLLRGENDERFDS